MPIQLTPEQERRVHDVISRGAYESVEEVVDTLENVYLDRAESRRRGAAGGDAVRRQPGSG